MRNLKRSKSKVIFTLQSLIFGLVCEAGYAETPDASQDRIRVMTFNLWHGGDAGGQPLMRSVEAIKAAMADVVGLQEAEGYAENGPRPDRGQEIAKRLGWHYFKQPGRRGILSRFPIASPSKSAEGVRIKIKDDIEVAFFNIHFAASPYQPYQLLNIKYGPAPFINTEEQAIQWANQSRGKQVSRLLTDMQTALEQGLPILLTGDFNEPSFQDWTARAAREKLCPLKVEYPATKRIAKVGLRDAYRDQYQDEIQKPGWTWTPTTSPADPADKHDRIDFVFVSPQWKVIECRVVGESKENADIVLENWPSDHRAVVAEVELIRR